MFAQAREAPFVAQSGGVQDGTVHDLEERWVTFDYPYNMRYPVCPDITTLTPAEYYSEHDEARVPCARCGTEIHFGPAVMALGALFGALNTMYSSVALRTREIGTLRALGFGSGPVIISVLLESLSLALIGGVIGAAVAYFAFDGFKAATINWQTFSQIAFAFSVTPQLLVKAIICALFIGLLGGLFPAIRAAHLPIAAALRET